MRAAAQRDGRLAELTADLRSGTRGWVRVLCAGGQGWVITRNCVLLPHGELRQFRRCARPQIGFLNDQCVEARAVPRQVELAGNAS